MNADLQQTVPLVVVGYDFRRASTRWRSRLVLKMDEYDELATQLRDGGMATGLALLSTCNRNELIASTGTPEWTGELLRARLIKRLRDGTGMTRVPEPYVYSGDTATHHMLRVAAGLESFVIGERQIASQLNCAMQTARKRGHGSVILNGLASHCGKAARDAARMPIADTGVRGVHDAAVRFVEQRKAAADKNVKVLVVGIGDIGKRVAQSVQVRTKWQVTLINRTLLPTIKPAVQPLTRLGELLPEHDVAIVCTGAFEPVLEPHHLAGVDAARGLLVLDLGIPLQVDPEVAAQGGVELVNLDGLEAAGMVDVVDHENLARLTDELIVIQDEFARFCRERELVTVLKTTQTQHQRYVQSIIPAFIDEELPELDAAQRAKIAFKLNGLIREYTNSIFNSIHKTSMDSNHED